MTDKLSDKEKALLILEKANECFTECAGEIRKLNDSLYSLTKAFEETRDMLKRCLNEEQNNGNVHKDCEYYDLDGDYCGNYLMGRYTGLAFEVSRWDKCIEDLVEEDD